MPFREGYIAWNSGAIRETTAAMMMMMMMMMMIINIIMKLEMSREKDSGQSQIIKTDNRSLERVEQFKSLGTTLTNQNSIQEEIQGKLKSVNACYYSVQNL